MPTAACALGHPRVARDQWQVLIRDHHEGYITWEQYLAIEAKMAANQTSAGARPPREGAALCQGIIYCGCGRHMGVSYQDDGRAYYSLPRPRRPAATPGCQRVSAAAVDDAVTGALHAAIAPAELALAIAAAGEVTARRQRVTRAAELAVERARYQADRAERAFSGPANRKTGSSPAPWKPGGKPGSPNSPTPKPPWPPSSPARPRSPAPASSPPPRPACPALWHAPTTTGKDRKRLLRTLLGSITVMPAGDPAHLRIGLHWNSGATGELLTGRYQPQPRTNPAAIDLARQLGPAMSNTSLAAALNAAGHRTAHGHPFDASLSRQPPPVLQDPVLPAARRRGTHHHPGRRADRRLRPDHQVLDRPRLPHRPPRTDQAVGHPIPPDVEAACHQRAARSIHQHKDIIREPRRDGEYSITETAARLGIKPPRIYTWIKEGTLTARRGPGARLWIITVRTLPLGSMTTRTTTAAESEVAPSGNEPRHGSSTRRRGRSERSAAFASAGADACGPGEAPTIAVPSFPSPRLVPPRLTTPNR